MKKGCIYILIIILLLIVLIAVLLPYIAAFSWIQFLYDITISDYEFTNVNT